MTISTETRARRLLALVLLATSALLAGGLARGPIAVSLAAVSGACLAFSVVIAGLRALLSVDSIDGPTFAVARVFLDETIRRPGTHLLVAVGTLALVALPHNAGAEAGLAERVQSLLGFGFTTISALTSISVVALSVSTLSDEFRSRRVFSLLTAPLSRWRLLAGKWLGIALHHAALLLVLGGTLATLARLEVTLARDAETIERDTVREEILVAREVLLGEPAEPIEARAVERLRELMRESPEALRALGAVEARERGLTDVSEDDLFALGARRARSEARDEARLAALSVPPLRTEAFVFAGLSALGESRRQERLRWASEGATEALPDRFVTLRLRIERPVSRESGSAIPGELGGQQPPLEIELAIGDDRLRVDIEPGLPREVPVSVDSIDEQGRLRLLVRNPSSTQPTLVFATRSGLTIALPAGSFGANVARAFGALWLRLALLAALGLGAASVLSFPSAALLTSTFLFVAVASPYLVETVDLLHVPESTLLSWRAISQTLARALGGLLARYGELDPGGRLARGELLSWRALGDSAAWFGLWMPPIALLAVFAFGRRELARAEA